MKCNILDKGVPCDKPLFVDGVCYDHTQVCRTGPCVHPSCCGLCLSCRMAEIVVGAVYEHYNNKKKYAVKSITVDSENLCQRLVYQEFGKRDSLLYDQPVARFVENARNGQPRMKLVTGIFVL